MLNAKNLPRNSSGPKYPPVETGTYPARLVQFIVGGIQPQPDFKGEKKNPVLEIRIAWELLDEFLPNEDGEPDLEKPRWIWERMAFYSLHSEKAKSTKRYYALDPTESAGGDWGKLLGTPAMVTLVVNKNKNTGAEYNNVSSVSSMRTKEASKAPDLVNEPLVFDFYDPDLETLKKLPDWMKEYFAQAVDYKGSSLEEMIKTSANLDDEIPFEEEVKETTSKGKKVLIEEDDEEGWT